MKFAAILVVVFVTLLPAWGQGTAFTYQGSLKAGTNNANGNFDLSFGLYADAAGTVPLAALTNLNSPISNGLIQATLDFGSNVFNGSNLWLQIGIRTNGASGGFVFLSPLQALTPTPYAITAHNVTGTFSGNGSGLTNLSWGSIANKPTTIAGYGITDALLLASSNQIAQYAAPRTTNLDYLSSLPLAELGTAPAGVQANEFRTPPMGYCTWYSSGTSVNEYLLTNTISIMATNGMAAAGYVYVNIDDGWAGSRDTNGNIVVTLTNGTWYPQTPQVYVTNVFPHGMKYIADYAHSNGMKFGLYTTVGPATCAGYVGSAGHIQQDVATYAAWGVDYLKVETCSGPTTNDPLGQELFQSDIWGWTRTQYEAVENAIQTNYRPIFLNVSWWWNMQPWLPSEVNSWRGAGDSRRIGAYANSLFHFDFIANFSYLTGPGHYMDPDVLLADAFATPGQVRSIFGAYAMMSAPLIVSAPNDWLQIETNSGMISIDQDPLVMPAHVVGNAPYASNMWTTEDGQYHFPQGADQQVWVKNLQTLNGPNKALLFLNRATNNATMNVTWLQAGIPPNVQASVYDCYSNAYIGNFTSNFTALVPAQDCLLLLVRSGGAVPVPAIGLTYLSDLGWLDGATCSGNGLAGMFKDQSYGGGRLIYINGVAYPKGFGAFSPSSLSFYLGGLTGRFHSDYGFDDDCSARSTGSFQVWADGVKVYDSGVIPKSPTQTIDIPLSNVTNLSLITVPTVLGGNDTLDWGNTYVTSVTVGNGSGFTNLNAANLIGTVSDSVLSANVARLNASQTFTGVNVFNNNVGIGTNNPAQKLHVVGNILATGTITGSSDRNVKENFAPVNNEDVLAKVMGLPILRWNYKADAPEHIAHMGPMAQDFYAAFALGMDDKHISMVDADGVALAAIQALNKKLEEKTAEISALKERLERLEKANSSPSTPTEKQPAKDPTH